MVQYWVKGDRIHKYPIPSSCTVEWKGEKLYDSPPEGYEKCDNCFPELPR